MMHPSTELRFINPDVGYGVFATEFIPRGTVVWVLCRLDIVLPAEATATLPGPYLPIIDKYAYADGHGNQVLCWDHGRYLNHSCSPAMLGLGREIEIAVRDIAAGDELTCDYGCLGLTEGMPCRCGSPRCRGVIQGDDIARSWPEDDRVVAEALPLAAGVAQPLLVYLPDPGRFWDWVHGRRPVPSHRDYCRAPGQG